MTHHRLFVALAIPAPARTTLIRVMGGVAGARWQDDTQLHCTVRFLGELDGHAADDVAATLGGLAHPPIDAVIEGLGSFERSGRTDTLWIGVHPLSALRALHAKVGRLLARARIAPDTRAYRPHITLARFGRRDAPPAGYASGLPPPAPFACRLSEVRLYESILGRGGARYEVAERYELR